MYLNYTYNKKKLDSDKVCNFTFAELVTHLPKVPEGDFACYYFGNNLIESIKVRYEIVNRLGTKLDPFMYLSNEDQIYQLMSKYANLMIDTNYDGDSVRLTRFNKKLEDELKDLALNPVSEVEAIKRLFDASGLELRGIFKDTDRSGWAFDPFLLTKRTANVLIDNLHKVDRNTYNAIKSVNRNHAIRLGNYHYVTKQYYEAFIHNSVL
jgi:hypothetical protein